MKVRIVHNEFFNEIRVPSNLLTTLGWKHGDWVDLDIPTTGGGLRITKESDPIVLMSEVKEKHG